MSSEVHSAGPAVLSIPMACKRIGLSRSSLYKLSAAGTLRFTKILGKTVITATEVERYVRSLDPPEAAQ
jgi:excisionase family DNA binding protein